MSAAIAATPLGAAESTGTWLTVFLVLFGALFLTHLDISASERGLLPASNAMLYLAAMGLFGALAIAAGRLVETLDRLSVAFLANLLPVTLLLLWTIGHLWLVTRVPLGESADLAQVFPMFQLVVFAFGMLLASTPGFLRSFRIAVRVAILLLGTSIITEILAETAQGAPLQRTGGFALNANIGAFNLVALLTMGLDFRRIRTGDLALIMFSAIAVFATLSRSGLTQFGLVVTVYISSHAARSLAAGRPDRAAAIGLCAVAAVTTLFLTGSVISAAMPGVSGEFGDRLDQLLLRGGAVTSDPYRGMLYDYYLQLAYQRPFLGYGSGYTLNVAAAGAPLSLGPHSMYMRTWLDTGIWGLLMYTGFLLALLGTGLFRRDMNVTLLAILVLAYGFFSHNLIDNKTALTLIGLALVTSLGTDRRQRL